MQVRYKPGPKIKCARLVIEDKKTSSLQVANPATDEGMHSLLLSNDILNAAEIRINGARTNVLIYPCTLDADLISAQFCHRHNAPTEEIPTKSSFTAIEASKSTISKKVTIAVDVQRHQGNQNLPCQ